MGVSAKLSDGLDDPIEFEGPQGAVLHKGEPCILPYPEVAYRWLIRLAIVAAPNPLSILTTETPDAQLFSMPRSAAMPPKLAP